MPFTIPTLEEARALNRDFITAKLNAGAMIPNSALRVLADSNAGLAYLTLLYVKWLSGQFLPDTAEEEWLTRHANIWLAGGKKAASYSSGTVTVTGDEGSFIPSGTELSVNVIGTTIIFETTADVTTGIGDTVAPITAITAGAASNLDPGTSVSFTAAISGVDGSATVVQLLGGADEETVEDLRSRVLFRIQKPPMGGDADDYVAWALEVPGVTRAWASPLEMGIGTVTLRFMMDALRADDNPLVNGFPNSADLAVVRAHLSTKRPVAVKDFFVEAPMPEPINVTLINLVFDDASTVENIRIKMEEMLADRAAPATSINGVKQDAQTIYESWVSEAVSQAAGVDHFDLTMPDHVMPSDGHMAVIGNIIVV